MTAARPWYRRGPSIELSPEAWGHLRALAVVYIACLALIVVYKPFTRSHVPVTDNPNAYEAESWLNGRLDLATRLHDTADIDGRYYNVFPPAFTIIFAGMLAIHPGELVAWVVLFLIGIPLPGLSYWLFWRRMRGRGGHRRFRAAVWTIGYITGTSLHPILEKTFLSIPVWHANHALSQVGLVLFLLAMDRRVRDGRGGWWIAGMGLLIAAWTRQLTVLFLPVLWWVAISERSKVQKSKSPKTKTGRLGALIGLGVVSLVLIAVPLGLNWAKFGSPLKSGYAEIYKGRDDIYAREAAKGLFSIQHVPRNFVYMNFGVSRFKELREHTHLHDTQGTAIWWTTPVLLYIFCDLRRIWRQRGLRGIRDRGLLLASAGIVMMVLLYHSTGERQHGWNRFSLDYVVVLLYLVGPWAFAGWRRWGTLLLTAWSVVFFQWLVAW